MNKKVIIGGLIAITAGVLIYRHMQKKAEAKKTPETKLGASGTTTVDCQGSPAGCKQYCERYGGTYIPSSSSAGDKCTGVGLNVPNPIVVPSGRTIRK